MRINWAKADAIAPTSSSDKSKLHSMIWLMKLLESRKYSEVSWLMFSKRMCNNWSTWVQTWWAALTLSTSGTGVLSRFEPVLEVGIGLSDEGSGDDTANQSINQSNNRSSSQSTNQSINQSSNQSTNQSINQSRLQHSTQQSTNQSKTTRCISTLDWNLTSCQLCSFFLPRLPRKNHTALL